MQHAYEKGVRTDASMHPILMSEPAVRLLLNIINKY